MIKKFKTPNNLKFLIRPYTGPGAMPGYEEFQCGTVQGVWWINRASLDIMGIANKEAGNGHLDDAMMWLEAAAKGASLPLRICMILSQEFKDELIEKYGFVATGRDNEVLKTSFMDQSFWIPSRKKAAGIKAQPVAIRRAINPVGTLKAVKKDKK